MENINDIQLKILSRLLFSPNSRFKDLNTDSLSTDNFSYHIRALIGEKLIVKEGSYYSLSKQGKIVAAKLDTDTH
ncbi:hypothetical protein KJ605_02705, partial [Patescibacteria group bacterium]|nr:hypothetical protein [Patescibacteria group bacterium]MBU1970656.1 hypothetical protein [Patescibacteria group bacterium]